MPSFCLFFYTQKIAKQVQPPFMRPVLIKFNNSIACSLIASLGGSKINTSDLRRDADELEQLDKLTGFMPTFPVWLSLEEKCSNQCRHQRKCTP
jgi:hypothetical protein